MCLDKAEGTKLTGRTAFRFGGLLGATAGFLLAYQRSSGMCLWPSSHACDTDYRLSLCRPPTIYVFTPSSATSLSTTPPSPLTFLYSSESPFLGLG
jgi:hypothetical protein